MAWLKGALKGRAGASRSSVASMGVITGLVAVGITATYAATANSVALWADFLVTVCDTLAVLTAWLTLRTVQRGPSETYTFGHSRLESFAGFGIGQLMIASSAIIIGASVWRAVHPSAIAGFGVLLGLAANAVYAGINGSLFLRSRRMEREEASPTITAQRRLYLIKFLSNALMVTALGLSRLFFGEPWTVYIDPALSLFIGVSLLLAATKTLRSSAVCLVDRSLEERAQLLILRALAERHHEFEVLHGVRTRMAGPTDYVEIYLEFDPAQPMGEVQEVIEGLQRRTEELLGNAEVTIMPARRPPASLQ